MLEKVRVYEDEFFGADELLEDDDFDGMSFMQRSWNVYPFQSDERGDMYIQTGGFGGSLPPRPRPLWSYDSARGVLYETDILVSI